MRTMRVLPVDGGWMVDNDVAGMPLLFRAGAQAEIKAKALARLVADQGQQAQVVVHDRRGVVVGSLVVGPGRGWVRAPSP